MNNKKTKINEEETKESSDQKIEEKIEDRTEEKKTKQKIKKKEKDSTDKKESNEKESVHSEDDSSESIQPMINIGLVGHVDHGKTTLTEKLTGRWTDTHSEEVKRGITIRLGYADITFRKCPECEGIDSYTTKKICPIHNTPTKILRKVSFVDAPGHESLMATMLSGATIMDGALLLIAANESCPQPQTREHLMALRIAGIKNVIIVQNKIDLVSDERVKRNYLQIKEFLKGTEYENSPIIPISAQQEVNIDFLIKTIEETIETPKRDQDAEPILLIARSFDINKPGINPDKLKGGILGGAIVKGKLKVGDRIEIRPGLVVEEMNKTIAKPIFTTIVSCMTGGKIVNELGPGGSVAIQTTLDPGVVHSDSMTGNLVGLPGKLPKTWYDMNLEVHLLERVVGSHEEKKVDPIKINEAILLNVNGEKSIGFVYELSKNIIKCKLKLPLCAEIGDKVTVSRKIDTKFRLIGYAIIKE
jgi:translation initiation factor 2 subunit 3